MLLHGVAKLKGISGIENMLNNVGLPSFLAYGVYITEIVAPLLIMVGYRTRLAAAVFIFGVLFAIFLAHPSNVFVLNKHGGWGIELLGLFLFGGLTLFFTGGGKLALSSSNNWD